MRTILVILIFQCAGIHAAAEEKCDRPDAEIRVIVMDIETQDPSLKSLAEPISQAITAEAAQVDGYLLLSAVEIRAMLDQEAERQLAGCDDSSCLSELASALDAELLVSGSLERTSEGAPVLALSLLNTRAVITVNRVVFAWPGDPDRLIDVARVAAHALMLEPQNRPPGAIKINSMLPGASLYLDDENISAELSANTLAGIPIGPHQLRVESAGYDSNTIHLLVESKKTTEIDGTLLQSSQDWIWWTVAGSVLAAGAIAAITAVAVTAPGDLTVSGPAPQVGLAGVEAVKGN